MTNTPHPEDCGCTQCARSQYVLSILQRDLVESRELAAERL